jgi:acyl carrier protein
MTARLDGTDRSRMARRGIAPLSPSRALATFGRALESGLPHVVAVELDPTLLEDRSLLRNVRRAGAKPVALVEEWVGTVPALRRAAIAAFVTGQAAEILGLPASAVVPARQPFQELGLDSLMAVELRNAIGAALGTPQPPTLLFDHPTTDALCDHLLAVVEAAAPAPDDEERAEVMGSSDVEDLAALTEDEAELLLLAELGDPGRVP